MTKMKNDGSFNKYTFNEEVPEVDLYDKSDMSDIIYVRDVSYRSKINLLIAIAIFLIVSALLLSLFGMALIGKDYLWNDTDNVGNTITYNLFVSHSNNYYGRSAVNFEEYNTSSKTLDYSFDVRNSNPIDINYKIILNNPYFGEDNVDMSLINYSLYINQEEITSGKLKNEAECLLSNITIGSNANHNVLLKLWSSDLGKNNKFNFKIDVIS